MEWPRSRDTEHPKWRRHLKWKSAGTGLMAVWCLTAWIFGIEIPLLLGVVALAAASLFGWCWLVGPARREGAWQLANCFDTLMQLALFAFMFHGLPTLWWWVLAVLLGGMYLLIAMVELTSAWVELRR